VTGIVYDAAPILGFVGKASSEPLPRPAPDEVVIRVGAWSLNDLRTCKTVVRDKLMWRDSWADDLVNIKLTPGIYRVRICIPGSSCSSFDPRRALLFAGEEIAPAALVATVLLCHLKQTGRDLLQGDWVRCAEVLPGKSRMGLRVDEGRVHVDRFWDDQRYDYLWFAACRKC
jgi:hypothetical protein